MWYQTVEKWKQVDVEDGSSATTRIEHDLIMPSWTRSYWIAFWSVIVGTILSIFWLLVAGIVVTILARSELATVVQLVTENRIREIFYLPELYLVSGIVLFFLILSGLSFYAVLVKYTWNEVHKEMEKLILQHHLKKDDK